VGEIKQVSKYHLRTKTGKRKQFNRSGGASRWLRTRHRIKKRIMR
jgi:hypothetical protein